MHTFTGSFTLRDCQWQPRRAYPELRIFQRHFRARRSLPPLIVEGFPFSNFAFSGASYALLIASPPIIKKRRK
jgi:hypothetical protein